MDNFDISMSTNISLEIFSKNFALKLATKKCGCKNKICFTGSVNILVVIVDILGLGTKWAVPIDIDTAIVIIDR